MQAVLVYKFRPERTGFNMYTTAINFPVHDKIGLDTLDTLQCDRNVAFRAQWTLT